MQNSNEKIQKIVKTYTPEIYIKTQQFIGLISDFFPNEEIGYLLKIVIEKNGSIEVYELIKNAICKNFEQLQLQTEYKKLISKISKKTFIDIEKLQPAIDLLFSGLGYDIYVQIPTKQTQEKPIDTNPHPIQTPETEVDIANLYSDLDGELLDLIEGIYSSVGVDDEELFNYIKGHTCFAGADDDVLLELKNGLKNLTRETTTSNKLIDLQNMAKTLTNLDIPLIPKTPSLQFKIDNNVLISYNAKSPYINIPSIVNEISNDAFRDNLDITTVVIPENVTKIGISAFMKCSNLTEVYLPPTITTIKKFTFNSCSNLIYINLKNIVTIENAAFFGCSNLKPDIIQYIKYINPNAL